ncbi:MAG: hypothetical protein U0175_39790 [Caldilineaceae bacterium]
MESVRDYELKSFFLYVTKTLECLNIPYMVVGGFAAIFYGEPRMTLDVDILVDMQTQHISAFIAAFPFPQFYVSEDAIRDSLQRRYPFNVIQPSTGAKVDLVPLPTDPFSRLSFQRRQQLVHDESGNKAYFIMAEDIVVAKLIAYQETNSDKHLRDVRGVLTMQWGEINLEAIRRGARGTGALEVLEQILELVRRDLEE